MDLGREVWETKCYWCVLIGYEIRFHRKEKTSERNWFAKVLKEAIISYL